MCICCVIKEVINYIVIRNERVKEVWVMRNVKPIWMMGPKNMEMSWTVDGSIFNNPKVEKIARHMIDHVKDFMTP